MIAKEFILSDAMEQYPEDAPYAVKTAIDTTLDTVLLLLGRKRAEHVEKGNHIATAVIDDIIKEFY